MSIHPGYSGQAFIRGARPGPQRCASSLPAGRAVQVDGGVGPENIRSCREAGATLFVAGSSVFGRDDLPRAYRELVEALRVSLERALELAERGRGTTHPNPLVGAVLVRDGEVVGEGWHERGRAARRGRRARARRASGRAGRRST